MEGVPNCRERNLNCHLFLRGFTVAYFPSDIYVVAHSSLPISSVRNKEERLPTANYDGRSGERSFAYRDVRYTLLCFQDVLDYDGSL